MPNKELNLVLDVDKIIFTIQTLEKRIGDRFPDSGLLKTCKGFLKIAQRSSQNITELSRPNIPIRAFTLAIIVIGLGGIIFTISLLNFSVGELTLVDIVTTSEAGINDLVLLGAAIFFLVTLEIRLKRRRAVMILDQLRGLAHIVDMHQLTKDPVMLGAPEEKTEHSPARTLNKFELQRYLDYCSEMLSLIGKVAALYSQSLPDDVVVGVVNEIESLTSDLSRKIWQKIIILADIEEDRRDLENDIKN